MQSRALPDNQLRKLVKLRAGVEPIRKIDWLPNIGADAGFDGLFVKRARNTVLDGLQRDRLCHGE